MKRQYELYVLILISVVLMGGWMVRDISVQAQEGDEDVYIYLPLITRGYDSTWQWTEVYTPTISPSPYNTPVMAIDHQGQVHLFWDTLYSPRFIYHTYLTDSGWTTPTLVAPSLGVSSILFSPVIGPDGTVHLLWHNQETISDPERVLYASFADGSWGQEEEVFRSPRTYATQQEMIHHGGGIWPREPSSLRAYANLQGMVHLDDAGKLHATMVDGSLLAYVYHTVRGASGWSTPIEVSQMEYITWVWPDRWGGIHFYGNETYLSSDLWYSYWRGGEFLVSDRQLVARVSDRQTQLDGQNNLHIFWTDLVAIPGGSVTGLFYQCLDNELQLGPETLLSGEESVSSVVKADSAQRWTALAWRENGLERVRLALWEGCTQTDLKTVPLPGTDAEPWTMAVSDVANKLCLLSGSSGYIPDRLLICANISR